MALQKLFTNAVIVGQSLFLNLPKCVLQKMCFTKRNGWTTSELLIIRYKK
jgi:hypothetical protein